MIKNKIYKNKYEVTPCGKVFNLDYSGSGEKKEIRQYLSSSGYYMVGIPDGRSKSMYVHRLVATLYVDNPHGNKYVCHKDSSKNNNCFENLYWGTAKENSMDASMMGRHIGNKNPIITESLIKDIRDTYVPGEMGYKKLVKKFGISRTSIMYIVRGITHKNLL